MPDRLVGEPGLQLDHARDRPHPAEVTQCDKKGGVRFHGSQYPHDRRIIGRLQRRSAASDKMRAKHRSGSSSRKSAIRCRGRTHEIQR
jgi:hypothetical protein